MDLLSINHHLLATALSSSFCSGAFHGGGTFCQMCVTCQCCSVIQLFLRFHLKVTNNTVRMCVRQFIFKAQASREDSNIT